MFLLALPPEVLLLVGDVVESQRDMSSLTRVNRYLNTLLSDALHKKNIRDSNSSALFWGMRHNRPDLVERMLDLGADVDSTCCGQTAIYTAACEGHAIAVKILLSRGATHRLRDGQPWTPLFSAAAAGHTDVVAALLTHEGRACEAIRDPDPSFTRMTCLLQHIFVTDGSRVQRDAVEYSIPLFMAIAGAHNETARVLIRSKKVSLDYQDRVGRTALMWALSHGREAVIECLLDHGADANIPEPSTGETLLHKAVRKRHDRVMQMLLARADVDPNCRDSAGRCPLFDALEVQNRPVLKALVARSDLDVNCWNGEGLTPLLYVVQRNLDDQTAVLLMKLLLDYPAIDVDASSEDGRTPLSYTSELGRVQLVDLLLSRGADPGHKCQDGRAAHSYAAQAGHTQVFMGLIQTQKVQLDSRDSRAWTPLFWAAASGQQDMVRLLLELGADPDVRDGRGMTALAWALEKRHLHVARDLQAVSTPDRGSQAETIQLPGGQGGSMAASTEVQQVVTT
ncbi:ankyrin repeat-containing domain protein [Aspergillus aurantiobrunneus]